MYQRWIISYFLLFPQLLWAWEGNLFGGVYFNDNQKPYLAQGSGSVDLEEGFEVLMHTDLEDRTAVYLLKGNQGLFAAEQFPLIANQENLHQAKISYQEYDLQGNLLLSLDEVSGWIWLSFQENEEVLSIKFNLQFTDINQFDQTRWTDSLMLVKIGTQIPDFGITEYEATPMNQADIAKSTSNDDDSCDCDGSDNGLSTYPYYAGAYAGYHAGYAGAEGDQEAGSFPIAGAQLAGNIGNPVTNPNSTGSINSGNQGLGSTNSSSDSNDDSCDDSSSSDSQSDSCSDSSSNSENNASATGSSDSSDSQSDSCSSSDSSDDSESDSCSDSSSESAASQPNESQKQYMSLNDSQVIPFNSLSSTDLFHFSPIQNISNHCIQNSYHLSRYYFQIQKQKIKSKFKGYYQSLPYYSLYFKIFKLLPLLASLVFIYLLRRKSLPFP